MKTNTIYGQILNWKNHKVVADYVHDVEACYTAVRFANGKVKRVDGSFRWFADIYLYTLNRNYDLTASRADVDFSY